MVEPASGGERPLSWATVLVLILCSACTSPAATVPTASSNTDVAALRDLERPVLSAVKAATTRLAANDLAGAADQLTAIGQDGRKILDWLDAHSTFAKANSAVTDCLRETMTDLGEQAESLVPHLRAGDATTNQLNKLRLDLGEAGNCVQSGD